MPWMVEWQNGGSSGPYETEWEAERHGCTESRRQTSGGFRLADLAPPPGLTTTMLEPRLASEHWARVAEYIGQSCDRFWIHWWFRPSNDNRSLWDQLLSRSGSPEPEPLPHRDHLSLKRPDPAIDSLEHSWICPNGVAATGSLDRATLALLLKREDVHWWDLHLYGRGRRRFVATDGGTEHFACVTAQDLEYLAPLGVPTELFRLQ
ncbi:MAG TPA: hypothetical protein VD973_07430 [Symbiobacteriaceae bacterium]|nr:hypothetical protein [Symbiobacteriaceae bacterium]